MSTQSCCPYGSTVLARHAAGSTTALQRADRDAYEAGPGAHVHADGDDFAVVLPLAAPVPC